MKFNPSRPAKWIANQEMLERVIPALVREPYLAVDTESNSLFAYREQVCLIQFSTTKEDYLIDTYVGLDLSNLAPVFSNSGVQKIFHAAEYDIVCLKRDYGFVFNNIFDTMQAARILGFKKLGLSDLLEGQFHVEPVKSFQKANWGKRPLSADMMQYARLDTHFLIPLRARLHEQLKKKKLMALAQEDFGHLCRVENNHRNAPLYTHISGYYKLSPRKLAILDALCAYRDKLAAQADRPHFKIIGSRVLLALAEAGPLTLDALTEIKDLSPRLIKRYGKGLITAIQKGQSAPPIHLKKGKRPPQEYINRVEALKLWRKNKGKKVGVQSDIILPKGVLERIAGAEVKDIEELQKVMQEVPWRFNHFGGEILNVIIKGTTA
ncbi:MAG: HRDC domain-containing protein [Anaerolineaceae bacterium]|nr:HRDC domain-containing protein [Anaerolineaceae bacterium]